MNNKKHMEDILYYFEKYHYENMMLDDNVAKFIHDYIINLQFKIDKAIEYIENHFIFDDENGEYYQTHTFDKSNTKELYDILKENK